MRKVHRLVAWLVCAALMLGCMTCFAEAARTATGTAKGFGGDITVEVTVDGDVITDVAVTAQSETVGIGTNAIDQLPARIVAAQSIAVDAVSGCTVSSTALLSAVEDALVALDLDVEAFKVPPAEEAVISGEDQTLDTDVVVVGAGLAGLLASIKAKELGADVILLEKMSFTGGNSSLSSGSFLFGGTDMQAAIGIEDTADAFYEFGMESSDGKRDPIQVRLIADMGNESINWMKSLGLEFMDDISTAMGCPVQRKHKVVDSNSPAMIATLTQAVKDKGVQLFLNTPATELIVTDDGAVRGVQAVAADGAALTINAKQVILASGGFAANPDLLLKYWGKTNIGYAGSPGATGEMTEAALALGADTMDIDIPWYTPTIEITTNTLMTSDLITKGAILVTADGKRFCDEAASYGETSESIFQTGAEYVYEIFDAGVRDTAAKVSTYRDLGVVHEADTPEALALLLNLPPDQVKESVETYTAAVRGEIDDPFGRTIVQSDLSTGPYYGILVKPGTIMSPGGLKVDANSQVVKTDGQTIDGLFAVGETTGGYRAYGYQGGDSLSHCVVSALAAAKAAAGN